MDYEHARGMKCRVPNDVAWRQDYAMARVADVFRWRRLLDITGLRDTRGLGDDPSAHHVEIQLEAWDGS